MGERPSPHADSRKSPSHAGQTTVSGNSTPRTFIAKILNFKHRDAALKLAREKGNIPFGNVKVAVFPDFSAEVQRRRQGFMEAKRKLRDIHLKYAMLFPAKL